MSAQQNFGFGEHAPRSGKAIQMAPACCRLPGQPFSLTRYESQLGVSSGHQGPFLTPACSFAAA